MRALDEGHVYALQAAKDFGGAEQVIVFAKRSSGAVRYEREWGGLQTQEVLRALIDRTKFLDNILPCDETKNALYFLRMALYEYEARAYRRGRDEKNRTNAAHNDTEHLDVWREGHEDVPFTEHEIELRPIGPDGHIILDTEESQ